MLPEAKLEQTEHGLAPAGVETDTDVIDERAPRANQAVVALLAFAAGFAVRPFGALVFGRLGDLIGRKYTFLVTILVMGLSTFVVGILPNYESIGIAAPVILIGLRLLQGLALGGEYGGAAIYVAEHAPPEKRGYYTAFIQASVVGGFVLSIAVVLICRALIPAEDFAAWGWRIPFLLSIILLGISLWMRLKLSESPVFRAMKAEGRMAKNPFVESFTYPGNKKRIFVALFGITAGLTTSRSMACTSTMASYAGPPGSLICSCLRRRAASVTSRSNSSPSASRVSARSRAYSAVCNNPGNMIGWYSWMVFAPLSTSAV